MMAVRRSSSIPLFAGRSSELPSLAVGCTCRRGRRCPTQVVVGRAHGEIDNVACEEVTGVGVRARALRMHIGRDAAAWRRLPTFAAFQLV